MPRPSSPDTSFADRYYDRRRHHGVEAVGSEVVLERAAVQSVADGATPVTVAFDQLAEASVGAGLVAVADGTSAAGVTIVQPAFVVINATLVWETNPAAAKKYSARINANIAADTPSSWVGGVTDTWTSDPDDIHAPEWSGSWQGRFATGDTIKLQVTQQTGGATNLASAWLHVIQVARF